MRLPTLAAMLFISLNGCAFHSEPEDNQDFYQISRMSELTGVYKNKGNPSGYLSEVVWGHKNLDIIPEVNHSDIEFIAVTSAENSLIVKAIKNGCVIYEKPYISGQDFKISGGKIIIHRDAFLLSRGADDVLAGPSYEEITLGLDTGKHGKYRRSGYGAGLIFLLFPVAFSETSDTRFERVNDTPAGFKACGSR